MMPEENTPSSYPNLEPRIRILKFLCILTFAGSGLGALSFGFIGTFFNIFLSIPSSSLDNEQQELIRMLLSGGRYFFLLNALLYSVSFTGAYMMYKFKKAGFHVYTISQILILISPLAFINGFHMPGINVALTLLFIVAYAGFVKMMH
jgi:hypothetical protein